MEDIREKVILVGVDTGVADDYDVCMQELKSLAEACHMQVVGILTQKMEAANKALYIGTGKVEELRELAKMTDAELVVFEDSLTPSQLRNLKDECKLPVMDRTNLILDIFASRAKTREAKLQVEVARLKYLLPRLVGLHDALSRQGGASGSMSNKGAGEKKLELDRRKIEHRITELSKELETVSTERRTQRKRRRNSGIPQVSLAGYTNAGKSTLLNTLTNSDIYAKDQLFATLDPTTRQLTLPNKQEIIITDTVGFIQRLPHQLIAAFRSTLEVVTEADLLVHVIDVSHELYKEQATAVHEVLKEIGAETKPVITVYNKIDKLPPDSKLADRLALEEDTVCISAAKKLNLESLQQMIESHLKSKAVEVTLCIPYAETAKAAQLHETANVLEQEYTENGAVMKVILPVEDLEAYNEYILKSE